jgi:hypothetical protein
MDEIAIPDFVGIPMTVQLIKFGFEPRTKH